MKILCEKSPRITFSTPEIFVDHSLENRSGHLGHAMVECADGAIIAFYSNCSGVSGIEFGGPGHSMYGWVEYKISLDRGITWGEAKVLQYSYDCFMDGVYKIGCEKAVCCDDGTLVVFCLRSIGKWFEPYATPVCLISHDRGETWSNPIEVSDERGRIYDAFYKDGRIYVLEFCNSTDKGFTCNEEGKFYKIFASDDNGNSFYEYSVIPFDTMGHAYGNMVIREDGSLVFYAYNVNDEYNLTGLISEDMGKTWSAPFKVAVAKIARNPQVNYLNGWYFLHGRSEEGSNFVVYHSKDGIHWDEGKIVSEPIEGKQRGGYYSNNLAVVGADGKKRLLLQYSEDYTPDTSKVNIIHAWIECED
ncbi:MAG: exo-alpha-sialidase [Clostridia bacterium]|nr:exo-alpha-sialidase [Clostridia bacterium]